MAPGESASITALKDVPSIKTVHITPFADSMEGYSGDLFEEFLQPYLGQKYPPLRAGDIIRVTSSSTGANSTDTAAPKRQIDFKITSIELLVQNGDPKAVDAAAPQQTSGAYAEAAAGGGDLFGIVGPDTEIVCDGTPLERSEDNRFDEMGYSDLGGCKRQLNLIRELVELPLLHPEVFRTLGIPPPKGVLLHGPPGSGKTSLARAVATETGAYFHVINGPEIMSKLSGESEAKLRKVTDLYKCSMILITIFTNFVRIRHLRLLRKRPHRFYL